MPNGIDPVSVLSFELFYIIQSNPSFPASEGDRMDKEQIQPGIKKLSKISGHEKFYQKNILNWIIIYPLLNYLRFLDSPLIGNLIVLMKCCVEFNERSIG